MWVEDFIEEGQGIRKVTRNEGSRMRDEFKKLWIW